MKKHFVVAVYNDTQKAKEAVAKLIKEGIKKEHISVIAKTNEDDVEKIEIEKEDSDIKLWGTQGALWGSLIGALLGGAFFFVPGFGPIVGVGAVTATLAGTLGGAMTGAAVLGLGDALIEWGMGEIEAKKYEKLVEQNKVLVIVHKSEDEISRATEILKNTNPEKIDIH